MSDTGLVSKFKDAVERGNVHDIDQVGSEIIEKLKEREQAIHLLGKVSKVGDREWDTLSRQSLNAIENVQVFLNNLEEDD